MKTVVMFAGLVSLLGTFCTASWQNPVLLTELNDFQNNKPAIWPVISSDETQLYFNRNVPGVGDCIFESRLNTETGLYEQQRRLSELKNAGSGVYGAWMSEDKLRLYYAGQDIAVLGPNRRPLYMAMRATPDGIWETVKRFFELETEIYLNSCSLTANELYIVWMAAPVTGGGVYGKVFSASRPSVFHDFSNVKEMTEFNVFVPKGIHLSQNGLKVYFIHEVSSGVTEAWAAGRDSLDVPFSNFHPITEINNDGFLWSLLCPTWSGQKMFYFQRQGEPGDANAMGIYVAEWADDSYEDAIANLKQAIQNKQQAADLIDAAIIKEKTASRILGELPYSSYPPGVTAKDVRKATIQMIQTIRHEEYVIKLLEMNISWLRYVLWPLTPPVPVPSNP